MSWARVRGHDHLIEGFARVVARGRLAHGYLFAGPVGVGKRLFATELGRALLCETPPGPLTACDVCSSCVQIDAGSHPDFITAARPPEKGEFPIDLMRALCANFSLKSARGRGKVIVIDDVDDLNDESANCFLKTLEEPPAGALLILIGTSPQRQLPTILSRVQVVRFAPLSESLVRGILPKLGIEDSTQFARLARLSGGSPGLALTLSDPAIWAFRQSLLAGLTGRHVDPVALNKEWLAFVEEAGKESAGRRRRAQVALRLVIDFLDDALSVAEGGEPRRTGPEDAARVREVAARLGGEALLLLLDRCLEADEQIDRDMGIALVLEALLDSLAQRMG
jgi:DNA polymerase-3 subunit delta'